MASDYLNAAFFDVDGTIINTRSILSFMEYLRKESFFDEATIELFYDKLREMIVEGQPREKLNRFYYTIYEGCSVDEIQELANKWFRQQEAQDNFYNSDVVELARSHVNSGVRVVLVTGSFFQLLKPLTEKIHVDDILCSRMEVNEGRFTGKLLGEPCIGVGKANAMKHYARSNDLNMTHSFAYGDDITDMQMLNLVGNPVLLPPCEKYANELNQIFKLP